MLLDLLLFCKCVIQLSNVRPLDIYPYIINNCDRLCLSHKWSFHSAKTAFSSNRTDNMWFLKRNRFMSTATIGTLSCRHGQGPMHKMTLGDFNKKKVKQRLFYRDGLFWILVWYANSWSVMESALCVEMFTWSSKCYALEEYFFVYFRCTGRVRNFGSFLQFV